MIIIICVAPIPAQNDASHRSCHLIEDPEAYTTPTYNDINNRASSTSENQNSRNANVE